MFLVKRAQTICLHGLLLIGLDNKGQLLVVQGMATVSKLDF